MERIYRLITSYTEEQSEQAVNRFSDYELKEILDLADRHQFYTLKYNGEVCHWREGELEYVIIFCDEKTIKKFKDFDERAHVGMEGYTHIDLSLIHI